jgi:hypothetical protein
MLCPKCEDDHKLRRIQRKGFLQTRIYPLFGYYPWKCSECEILQLHRDRGERKRVPRESRSR